MNQRGEGTVKISQEQYTELSKKIDNMVWRDTQRRKQVKANEKNIAVLHSNDVRHEQIVKAKLTVDPYDEGYEEPYDKSEQENGK